MSAAEREQLNDLRRSIQFRGTPELGYTDSGFWLFLNYVYTKDSHDVANAVKLLPVGEKDYLKVVILFMLACDRLLIPKSRQIMMSWLMSAFGVWHAMVGNYRHVVYQTKKEEDGADMVSKGNKAPKEGRMDFIIQNLPDWLRDPYIGSGKGNKVGELIFSTEPYDSGGAMIPWYGSKIESVPGGEDQIASKTPSCALIDEASYHAAFAAVVGRALPALTKGAPFHAASSVCDGSDFNVMVLDTPDGQEPTHKPHEIVERGMKIMGIKRMPHGMKSWPTRSGFWVCMVHYTADPEKDPERDGHQWYLDALKGFPGGEKGDLWQREMEINFGAGGGQKVFPFLSQGLSPVFVPRINPDRALATMNVFAGYDYGTSNPSAFEVWGIDERGRLYALWELYEPCTNAMAHVARIKACPYFSRLEFIACDPALFKRDQHRADGTLGSTAELFGEAGLYMIPGTRAVDHPMALRFNSTWWADPDNPLAFITDDCVNLKEELRGLRFKEHKSKLTEADNNQPEKIVAKKNHAWDASCYALDKKPMVFNPKEVLDTRQSIEAFIARAEQEKGILTGVRRRGRGGIISV